MQPFSLSVQQAAWLCAGAGALLYFSTLDLGFCFDDLSAIKQNNDLHPSTPWLNLLWDDFWGTPMHIEGSHKSYRPLCVASFRLNYMLHGLEPLGYHLVNVLLHAVVCYLYVQLCALVFAQVWPALMAGLLFAVHPIHTEAVAGIVGRAELLSAFFFLLSFHVYHQSLTSKKVPGWGNWMSLSCTILLSVLALLSKEQGISALAVCLIYDFFIFNLFSPDKKTKPAVSSAHSSAKGFFKRGVVISAAGLVVVMLRLALSNGTPSEKLFTPSVNPPLALQTPYRQLSWLHLVCVNLMLLLNPSHLSADWRYGAVPLVEALWDVRNLYTLCSLAALALLSIVGLLNSARHSISKPLLLGLSLLIVPFLPASNLLFPVGFVVAERVLYLPSMGYCMLVALGAWLMLRKVTAYRRGVAIMLKAAMACLLVLHSAKTVVRNRDWHSATSLHQAMLRFNPSNPVTLSNLGIEHALRHDFSRAELLYRSSMQLGPTYSGGFHNFGILMKLLHRYDEAEEPLVKSIELGVAESVESRLAERYDLLVGVIAMNTSRLEEALQRTKYVLHHYPSYSPIYNTRCSILIKLNRTDEFVQACELAVTRNRRTPGAHYNLGVAYMKLGFTKQAERSFRNMLVLDHKDPVGLFHLAYALQSSGQTPQLLEARQLWKQMLLLERTNVEVLMNLAEVDFMLHHFSESLDSLEAVLEVQPQHTGALYWRAKILYQREQYEEVISSLDRLNAVQPQGYRDSQDLLSKARNRTSSTSSSSPSTTHTHPPHHNHHPLHTHHLHGNRTHTHT